MPRRRTNHWLRVNIECLDERTNEEAADRLQRWLETYGYTSPGHGFEFYTVTQSKEDDNAP